MFSYKQKKTLEEEIRKEEVKNIIKEKIPKKNNFAILLIKGRNEKELLLSIIIRMEEKKAERKAKKLTNFIIKLLIIDY